MTGMPTCELSPRPRELWVTERLNLKPCRSHQMTKEMTITLQTNVIDLFDKKKEKSNILRALVSYFKQKLNLTHCLLPKHASRKQ